MNTLLAIAIFICVLCLIEVGYFALKTITNPEKGEIRKRLQKISTMGDQNGKIDILRKSQLSNIPWLNRLLSNFPVMNKLTRLLEQAGVPNKVGIFIFSSFLLALAGYFGGSGFISYSFKVLGSPLLPLPFAAFFGMLPFFYIKLKKKRRIEKFQAQLPEALDLIARSLRAGHAFSGGLKMVSDEMRDPIGTEFTRTLNEINFGVGVPEALKNLANRVDCEDLKFFVISVIMQRETGGNLAEILENLSYLIRERFKLYGHIRVLSSQARLSAYILVALPIVMAFVISFLRPGYFDVFFTDPMGTNLLIFAFFLMILGILAMKKMIKIRV